MTKNRDEPEFHDPATAGGGIGVSSSSHLLDDGLGTTSATLAIAAEAQYVPSASDTGTGAAKKRIRKKKKDLSSGDHGVEKVRRRRKKSSSAEQESDLMIKRGSLVLLVAQMVGLVMLMRYTRTRTEGDMYISSTAVFVMEVSMVVLPTSRAVGAMHVSSYAMR